MASRDGWKPGSRWRRLLEGKSIAEMFHQKYVEIRCQRLSTKLPHRQRDLTSMIGGVVDDVLHQVHQGEPRTRARSDSPSLPISHKVMTMSLGRKVIGRITLSTSSRPSCSDCSVRKAIRALTSPSAAHRHAVFLEIWQSFAALAALYPCDRKWAYFSRPGCESADEPGTKLHWKLARKY